MEGSTLVLRVVGERDAPADYDVVAQILSLAETSTTFSTRNLVIPGGTRDGIDVVLESGLYNVQLFLPTGRIIQQSFDLRPGDRLPVTFVEPSTGAQSNFSLQTATGSSSLLQTLGKAARSRRTGPTTNRPSAETAGSRSHELSGKRAAPARVKPKSLIGFRQALDALPSSAAARREPRQVRARERARSTGEEFPVLRLSSRKSPSTSFDWSALGQPSFAWPVDALRVPAIDPNESRRDISIWRLPADLAGAGPGGNRIWAVVDTSSSREVVSLPAPWRCSDTSELSPLDVLVDAALGGRAASAVAVHDRGLDGLLSYLDQGRISFMRPIIDAMDTAGTIERAIFDKAQNPLAACAAAYAGLALFEPGEQERWDGWLPRLMTLFPWLPDGGVVHARRIMLRPKHTDESGEILAALKHAYHAGIPYYSAGVLLMREMLANIALEQSEAGPMLESVSRIAARIDPKRMFTVLRYPRG